MPLDPVLQVALRQLSGRAVIAFTIGTAEWIFYRFGSLEESVLPWQCAEAGWAQIVDFRYSTHSDIDLEKWRGPVRGPIGIAMRRVRFVVNQTEVGGEPTWRAGRVAKLAEHVLPDSRPYREWRDVVMERLRRIYPASTEDPLGEVVPREAVDLAPFDPADTTALVNRFLSGLDPRSNPFIDTPEFMRSQGFEGTPFAFDAEEDRRRRLEW